jgi:hypothetical protein
MLSTLPSLLTAAGIERAVAHYNGVGDEGWIEEVVFLDAQGNACAPPAEPASLPQDVSALFFDVLGLRYPGWEINGGSSGELTWQPGAQSWHHRYVVNPDGDDGDLDDDVDDELSDSAAQREPERHEETFTDADAHRPR